MTSKLQTLSFAFIFVALGGCASNRPPDKTAGGSSADARAQHRPGMAGKGMMGQGMAGDHRMGGGMMSPDCPMNVPGTSVAAADTEGGVALTFTTTKSDEVAELRKRVQRMADMHDHGGMMGGGMMGGGMMGGGMMGDKDHGMMGGGMMGPMPSATATTEEVDGGARLVFKPTDAAKLEALRDHVKKHAERMQQGRCPMMTAQAP